jgi:hypothetical protein
MRRLPTTPRSPLDPRDESGITLIELIFYAMLSVVIAILVGGLLISSLTNQRNISAVGQGTSIGQEVVDSVEEGVRTASSVTVKTTTLGNWLVTRTATFTSSTAAAWTCRYWIYRSDGSLRYLSTTSGTTTLPTTTTGFNSWTLLAEGMTTSPTTAAFFTASGTGVALSFRLPSTGQATPALIQNVVRPTKIPTPTGTGASSCVLPS